MGCCCCWGGTEENAGDVAVAGLFESERERSDRDEITLFLQFLDYPTLGIESEDEQVECISDMLLFLFILELLWELFGLGMG